MALEAGVPQALAVWNPQPAPLPTAKQSSGSSYRHREATRFRGVTKTSGTNTGLEKFDVQFVFCDHGTKKHPKIYGFCSAEAAASAFDILTCKRALEKGRSVAAVLSSTVNLGTNHPASNYHNEELLSFLASISRDDVIYGLKVCAKKGYALRSAIAQELSDGVVTAQHEAADRGKLGEPRQSYEASAKATPGERKRRASAALAGRGAAAAAAGMAPSLAVLGFSPSDAAAGAALGPSEPTVLSGMEAMAAAFLQSNSFQQAMLMQLGLMHHGQAEGMVEGGGVGPGRVMTAGQQQQGPGLGVPPADEGTQGLDAERTAGVLSVVQGPGQHTQAADVTSAQAAAAAAAAAAATGAAFLQELLRLASGASAELLPALDLVRLWMSLQPGAKPVQETHISAWYYQGLLPNLQACPDIGSVLLLCGHLWQSGLLRTLAGSEPHGRSHAEPPAPPPPPPSGTAQAAAGPASEENLLLEERRDQRREPEAEPVDHSSAENGLPNGNSAQTALITAGHADRPIDPEPESVQQGQDQAAAAAAAVTAAAVANNSGILHMLLQMNGMGLPAFVPGLNDIPGLALAGIDATHIQPGTAQHAVHIPETAADGVDGSREGAPLENVGSNDGHGRTTPGDNINQIMSILDEGPHQETAKRSKPDDADQVDN